VDTRTITLAAALVLAAALTSGCNKENESGAANTPPAVPPSSATAPSPPGPAGSGTGTAGAPSGPTGPAAGTPESKTTQHVEVIKVKNALMTAKPPLSAKTINVSFDSGAVHLGGTVPTAGQKTQAEKVARQAAGDKPVVNDLEVGK
jgi:hypothetical protein